MKSAHARSVRFRAHRKPALSLTRQASIGSPIAGAMPVAKLWGRARTTVALIAEGLCLSLVVISLASAAEAAEELSLLSNGPVASPQGAAAAPLAETPSLVPLPPKRAMFLGEPASNDAQRLADWVVGSGDNRRLPFVIVDKTDARLFVFDGEGQLRGAAAALLGLAPGDDSVAGIGDRKLSTIRPEERTTPAGRFVAALGRDLGGQDIVWVDYAAAISLHRVVTTSPRERRLQRLATASPLDNRISYGCINVPEKFYEAIVSPAFSGTNGIVYILPETRPLQDVFPAYDVAEGLTKPRTPEDIELVPDPWPH